MNSYLQELIACNLTLDIDMVLRTAWNVTVMNYLTDNPYDMELVFNDFDEEFAEHYPNGTHDVRYIRYTNMINNLIEYFQANYRHVFVSLANYQNNDCDSSLLFHGYDYLTGNLFLDKIGVFR